MMASIGDSGSPQYLVLPLPDVLSNRQRDKHLQDILVADIRSAFVLIAELQKTVTELKLHNIQSATSPRVSTPSTIKFTQSPAPHVPVSISSCTPVDADVPSPDSAAASSRLHPPLIMPAARDVGSSVVAMHGQPAQGGSPGQYCRFPVSTTGHSSVSCRRRLPMQCARRQDAGLDNLRCPGVPVATRRPPGHA